MKKWIALLLMACLLCSLLAGCGKKISSEEAYQIVLDDLGESAALAKDPHIHEAKYDGKPCYNIYVTVNGVSLNYVISETGNIIHKGTGEHSH